MYQRWDMFLSLRPVLKNQLQLAMAEMDQMSIEFDEAIEVLSKERDDIYAA